jgi:hypothetical protein
MTVHEESGGRTPSGEQYAITYGSSQAHVTQVGATLRSYTVDGQEVIEGSGSMSALRTGAAKCSHLGPIG